MLTNEKLYRIVEVLESPEFIKRISYPLNPSLGRCNDEKEPVFYCSENPSTPLYEIKNLKPGQIFAVGEWQVQTPIFVFPIGSEKTFAKLSSSRSFDFHVNQHSSATFNPQINHKIFEFLCDIFTEDSNKFYTQSAGISQAIMSHPNTTQGDFYPVNGIQYPTVKMNGNADNFALPKGFIDDGGLKIIRCELVRIIEVSEDKTIKLQVIDYADEFSAERICWKKEIPQDWRLREEFLFSKSKTK